MATLAVPALLHRREPPRLAGRAAPARQPGQLRLARAGGNTVRAWGDNSEGELGDGSTTRACPGPGHALKVGTTITSVRAGCDNSLALTSTGQVLAWGSNDFGQLGNGTEASSDTPVMVSLPAGTTVTAIRAGCQYSLALTSTGQVLAWGLNNHGQFGNGTTAGSDTPVPVTLPGHAKVRAISAGGAHNLALVSKRKVLAWGANEAGQLGDGRTGGGASPRSGSGCRRGVRVTAVAAGDQQSLGPHHQGQGAGLGLQRRGSARQRAHRQQRCAGPYPAAARHPGAQPGGRCGSALALTTKGKILAWGRNDHGQLGNGSTARRSRTPVRVKLRRKAAAISAGCTTGLARTASGRVLAWGDNFSGELGDGTTKASSTPVRVHLPVAAVAIGSGPDAFVSLAITREAAA